MAQTAAVRRASHLTIPALEAKGNLLALVPKAALTESHADIKIMVIGKSRRSAALVAELKSTSHRLSATSQRGRRAAGPFNIDVVVSHLDDDHLAGAPAMAALLSRVTRAVKRAVGIAGDDLVHRALERPSDMGAVVDLLRSALPLMSAERELDPELDTRVAALEAEDDLIRRAGGLKDTNWVSAYLGINAKSVAAKARRNELLAITRGDRNLYPAFQFKDGQVVSGIREILQVLPLTNGWSRLAFLLAPDPGLDDRTPLEAFQSDREAVLALAAGLDTQGAS